VRDGTAQLARAQDGDRAHVVKYCNEPTTTNDERPTTND